MDDLQMFIDEKPTICPDCGASLKYVGLGEYTCTGCKKTIYDDYGKVRVFLEKYPGANIVQVSNHTGVSKAAIRKMLEDDKLSVHGNRPHL